MCKQDLHHRALGSAAEYRIALVGAPSSGKSNLLITAVAELVESFAPDHGVDVTFSNWEEERQFRSCIQRLNDGWTMEKTVTRRVPKAFTLALTRDDGQSSLVYIYDAAGEDFEDAERLANHPMEFHDAIWLIIDPFAEAGIRDELLLKNDSEACRRTNPASLEASEILGRLLSVLERTHRIQVGRSIPVPVAVTLTKVDACGLDYELPIVDHDFAFQKIGVAADHFETPSDTIRHFLTHHGLGNLVRMIETRFPRVSYFSVSALGRSDDGSSESFTPKGVIAPLVWLLYYTDALCDTDDFDRGFVNFNWYLYRVLRGQEGCGPILAISAATSLFALVVFGLYLALDLVPFLLVMTIPTALILIYIGCLITLVFSRFD